MTTARGRWLALGLTLSLVALASVGCGEDPRVVAARQKLEAGDQVGALVAFREAVKQADPSSVGEIKVEAEAVVSELLVEAKRRFDAGEHAKVLELTTPMVNLPTERAEAYGFDGLARFAIVTRRVDFSAEMLARSLAMLSTYVSYLPRDDVNEQMNYPRYLYTWLGQTHGQLASLQAGYGVEVFRRDFQEPELTGGDSLGRGSDVGFIGRQVRLAMYARGLTRGVEGDEARVRALLEWCSRNLTSEKPGALQVDCRPYSVAAAGFAGEQQLAWTAVELLRQLDLTTALRLEPIAGKEERFDFLAMVRVGDGWLSWDPMSGTVRDDAPGAGSVVLLAGEAKSFYPRAALYESVIKGGLGAGPRLFLDPDRLLQQLLEHLHGRETKLADRSKLAFPVTAPGKPTIDIWRYPFEVEALQYAQGQREARMAAHGHLSRLFIPRWHQLAGDAASALAAYDAALADEAAETKLKPKGRLHATCWRALALDELGKREEAVEAYRALLADGAAKGWHPLLRQRLAELQLAAGDKAAARATAAELKGARARRLEQLLAAE